MEKVGQQRLGWCVVIADDDQDWRTLVTIALRRDGYSVIQACDGQELVSVYRSLDSASRQRLIVVSDLEMPALNGLEATAELHSINIDLPVVLITGASSPDIIEAATEVGVRAVLRKPVSGARILKTLNRLRDAA